MTMKVMLMMLVAAVVMFEHFVPSGSSFSQRGSVIYRRIRTGMRIRNDHSKLDMETESLVKCATLSAHRGIHVFSKRTADSNSKNFVCQIPKENLDLQTLLEADPKNITTVYSSQFEESVDDTMTTTTALTMSTANELMTTDISEDTTTTAAETTTTSTPQPTQPTTPMVMNFFVPQSITLDVLYDNVFVDKCNAYGGYPAMIKYKAQADYILEAFDWIDGDGVWVALRVNGTVSQWPDGTIFNDTEIANTYTLQDPGWGDPPRLCYRFTNENCFKVLNCKSIAIFKNVLCQHWG